MADVLALLIFYWNGSCSHSVLTRLAVCCIYSVFYLYDCTSSGTFHILAAAAAVDLQFFSEYCHQLLK